MGGGSDLFFVIKKEEISGSMGTYEANLYYYLDSGTVNPATQSNYNIWSVWSASQDRLNLLVPVTVSTNISGATVKINGVSGTAPHTVNCGWTTTPSLEAPTHCYSGETTYYFYQWSDGNTNRIRNGQTVDDEHSAYTYTAQYNTTYSVALSGPSTLNANQTGTFTANVTGGVPPLDYTWYRMELGDPPDSKEKPGTRRPPVGVWVHQSYFDGCSTATSAGVAPGFKMKVQVTDDDNTVREAIKTISIGRVLLAEKSQAAENAAVPLRFALSPAFPNPFNPVTTIPFETASDAMVTLEIFDTRGSRVATLVNTALPAGRHTRQWHATPMAAGVYLCRYTARPANSPAVTAVEKIMLLK